MSDTIDLLNKYAGYLLDGRAETAKLYDELCSAIKASEADAERLAKASGALFEAAANGANLERWYDDEIDDLWEALETALSKHDYLKDGSQ